MPRLPTGRLHYRASTTSQEHHTRNQHNNSRITNQGEFRRQLAFLKGPTSCTSGHHRSRQSCIETEPPLCILLLLATLLNNYTDVDTPHRPDSTLPTTSSTFNHSVRTRTTPRRKRSNFHLLSGDARTFVTHTRLVHGTRADLSLRCCVIRSNVDAQVLIRRLLGTTSHNIHIHVLLSSAADSNLSRVVTALTTRPRVRVHLFGPLRLNHTANIAQTVNHLFSLSLRRQHVRGGL